MPSSQCCGLMKGDLIKIIKIWEGVEESVIVGIVLNYDGEYSHEPFDNWEIPRSSMLNVLCDGVVKEVFIEEQDEIKLISPGRE